MVSELRIMVYIPVPGPNREEPLQLHFKHLRTLVPKYSRERSMDKLCNASSPRPRQHCSRTTSGLLQDTETYTLNCSYPFINCLLNTSSCTDPSYQSHCTFSPPAPAPALAPLSFSFPFPAALFPFPLSFADDDDLPFEAFVLDDVTTGFCVLASSKHYLTPSCSINTSRTNNRKQTDEGRD